MDIQVQDAFRTPNGHDQKRISLQILVTSQKLLENEIKLEAAKRSAETHSKANLSIKQISKQKSKGQEGMEPCISSSERGKNKRQKNEIAHDV